MNSTEEALVEKLVDFATEIRLGNGIDSKVLAGLRREIELSSRRWAATGGVVPGETVGVLLSLYPAMFGATGLYGSSDRKAIEDLADDLLEELLVAVDPEND